MSDEEWGESLFVKTFGIKSPVLKVLDFLMDNEIFDYSKTDIAKGAGLSRATLFAVWPRLEELCLVTPTREIGRAKMYQLNKGNPIVQKLMELDDAITDYYAELRCSPKEISNTADEKKDLSARGLPSLLTL